MAEVNGRHDVVVVGGVAVDYAMRGNRLPGPGESAAADQFRVGPGGKGANAAVAAARLGARVCLVAVVGADRHGDMALERLRDEGVDVTRVARDQTAPTALTLVQVDSVGRKQTMAIGGANDRLTAQHVRLAEAAIAAAGAVLVQLEIPLEAVVAALEEGARRGASTVLDPAPARELPFGILELPAVVTPNAHEASVMSGIEVKDRESARKAGRRLLERGVRAVAVEAGAEGKVLLTQEGESWLERLPVEAVDTTGAGDAFAAGLAVRLSEGASLEEAAAFANACSALASTALGAQAALPRREAVERLLAG